MTATLRQLATERAATEQAISEAWVTLQAAEADDSVQWFCFDCLMREHEWRVRAIELFIGSAGYFRYAILLNWQAYLSPPTADIGEVNAT